MSNGGLVFTQKDKELHIKGFIDGKKIIKSKKDKIKNQGEKVSY